MMHAESRGFPDSAFFVPHAKQYKTNRGLVKALDRSSNVPNIPRRLSTKQAVGLVRPELPHGRCQAIISFSAYDASMTQTLGER
jgi:hypothetical protein